MEHLDLNQCHATWVTQDPLLLFFFIHFYQVCFFQSKRLSQVIDIRFETFLCEKKKVKNLHQEEIKMRKRRLPSTLH